MMMSSAYRTSPIRTVSRPVPTNGAMNANSASDGIVYSTPADARIGPVSGRTQYATTASGTPTAVASRTVSAVKPMCSTSRLYTVSALACRYAQENQGLPTAGEAREDMGGRYNE